MTRSCSEIGSLLKKGRDERDLKISDVAHQLNIRPAYIKAMEEGRFSDLPGSIYSVGYLKIYAKLLQLNGKELLDDLKLSSKELMKNDIMTLQGDPYSQEIRPNNVTVVFSIVVTLLVYFFWFGQRLVIDNRNESEFIKAREEMIFEAIDRIQREID